MSMDITLASTIYPPESVSEAARAFSHLSAITVTENPTSTIAHVSAKDDESKVVDEFLNYLLMRSIEQQLNADQQ
jgi:hypothetical protein